jgi:MinD-like ATPase involved in chromosome partitioning or flagellar assembly
LSDIPSYVNPPEKQSPAAITVEEIAATLSKAKSHKASSPDGIPVFVLKLLGWLLLEYL